jgi:proteasome assembly chaperone (PAC2) family protein
VGMASALELSERPQADEMYMIAGWRQWADAGSVSSGLTQYLIETLGAKKIGRIKSDGFYLFQTPVSQFLFRPQVKFEEGYRKHLVSPRSEVFYWSQERNNRRKGLVLFLGDEPHMNVERYAEAFFDIAQQLGVKRVAATGGVYAVVPYDKDRTLTCTYSLPRMKKELAGYAVSFSNYEGGVSIGSYLNDRAEQLGAEYFAFYAFVPMYDFSQPSGNQRAQTISIEDDYKAWYGLMLRFNHMFKLRLDLADLEQKSEQLDASIHESIDELSQQMPNLPVREYLDRLTADFVEMPFTGLDDVWQDALGDIFKDGE